MNTKYINLESLKEFDNHKFVSFIYEEKCNLKGFVAIHRGGLSHPSFGATRFWNYHSEIDALKDALKLSRLMTYKAALAGLGYGGAKAVIFSPKLSTSQKHLLLNTYVKRVNYLNGRFITGADVGISDADLKFMAKESSYMVGVSSDPVKYTALGVFYSIQEALIEVFGNEDFGDRTFAVQGLGKTGMAILRLIYPLAKHVYVADKDIATVELARKEFPKAEVVQSAAIHKQEVDVFCPCALSSAVNLNNISKLKCKIIAGSANNQLQNDHIGELLYKLGICYAPDYVVNAGGLIAVVSEYENGNGVLAKVDERVGKIKDRLKSIFATSKRKHRATNIIANEMAEVIFRKLE